MNARRRVTINAMTPSRALPALALALVLLPACGGGDDKPAAAKTTGPPAVEPREYARALADSG